MSTDSRPVMISDIMSARKALQGYIYETPVINSNALARKTGHQRVLLKCENLQRTGSYHLRGHMYKVIRTTEQEMDVDTFVTFSTANGGAALSCAATEFQKTARIVIPQNLPDSIPRSITHYGGSYVETKPTPQGRSAAIAELMDRYNKPEGKIQHKAVFVHPYTDRHVISGYGTIGVEMMLQTDCQIDCVVSPIGGGSLFTGLAVAVKAMKPNVAFYGCRPTSKDICDEYAFFKRGDANDGDPEELKDVDRTKSLEQRLKHLAPSEKISDEARVTKGAAVNKILGSRYQHTNPGLINGIINVNDDEIRYAFRYIYERCKLVVDTKAAMAVAAVLAKSEALEKYKCVAIVLTGGNVNINEVPMFAVPKL